MFRLGTGLRRGNLRSGSTMSVGVCPTHSEGAHSHVMHGNRLAQIQKYQQESKFCPLEHLRSVSAHAGQNRRQSTYVQPHRDINHCLPP
jgi:hypothetical protein